MGRAAWRRGRLRHPHAPFAGHRRIRAALRVHKQFFAGEVEVLCSLPEFWRKVNLLHTGGDDFSVYGAWDALIGFARELQRLFHRFTESTSRTSRSRGENHQHGAGPGAGPGNAPGRRL